MTVKYDRIDEILHKNKMSRRTLAKKIGISTNTLTSAFVRKSKKSIQIEDLYRIANVLNVQIYEIVDFDKEKGEKPMDNMKKGYPNPTYTEQDVFPCVQGEIKSEMILDDQLIELIQKAALFDCLVNALKAMGKVDDDVVKAITGTIEKEEMVPKKEADSYWDYYKQEQNKTNELKEKVSKLEHARRELIEILRQNKIGEWGNTEEVKNDGENTDHRESDA